MNTTQATPSERPTVRRCWYLACSALFFFLAWFLLSTNLYGQTAKEARGVFLLQQADSLFYLDTPSPETDREALSTYRGAIDYLDASPLKVAEAYQKIGNMMEMSGLYDSALLEYRRALQEKQGIANVADTLFLTDYLYIGNVHLRLNNYDSSDLFYSQAEAIANRYDYVKEQESVFNSIGFLHYSLGNYRKALSYYDKTLRILDRHSVYEDSEERLIGNIAVIKTKLGAHDEAIKDYRGILDKDFRETFHQQLGKAYAETKQYDSARYFLKKSLRSKKLPTQLAAHIDLAEVYYEEEKYDSAVYYFTKSLAINQEHLNHRNTQRASAYFGLARLHQSQRRLDSALHYYQLTLINTTFNFSDSTVTANPQDATQAISLLHLFEGLQAKAGVWYQYYQQDRDTMKLKYALATYQQAIRVARHIQKTYDNDEAKLFLVNKVAPVYEEAIATAVQLYERTQHPGYVAQAFQLSEKSKAAVLAESLQEMKIKTSGGINDSLLQEERRAKQQITALRLKLIESQDSAQREAYRHQLTDQEISLARTIRHLQQDKSYYRRKYQPDTLNIAALQRALLRSDEALLEYFVGQQTVYLFTMTPDDLQVVPIDRTAELDSAWQRLRRHLYEYQPGQGGNQTGLATLYQYLLAPVARTLADVSRLTIIPDGILHHLPFELLTPDGRRDHYLLRTHTLHYGYSAALLQQAAREPQFPTKTTLAMAPFAGSAYRPTVGGFSVLRNSQTEVERVGGDIYTEERATKQRFLKMAGAHHVLHLATHAKVDSEHPSRSFIAFYPEERDSLTHYRLYPHELYNMRLDSVKLVVLSACEAGNGQHVRGEGVMSLARAFAYAGCPNTVTTLWKADDCSSAYLSARMHDYLKEGWEKDEALRQAKLDYLDDEQVLPSQKAPYYWAHFVFVGNPAPIYQRNYPGWWVSGGIILVFTVGGWLTVRRRGRRVAESGATKYDSISLPSTNNSH